MLRLFLAGSFAAGVALGMKAERFVAEDRCLDAGGAWDARRICVGVLP